MALSLSPEAPTLIRNRHTGTPDTETPYSQRIDTMLKAFYRNLEILQNQNPPADTNEQSLARLGLQFQLKNAENLQFYPVKTPAALRLLQLQ